MKCYLPFRSLVSGMTFGLFLFAQPAYFLACSGQNEDSGQSDFEYEEEDMRNLLTRASQASGYTFGTYRIRLHLEQSTATRGWNVLPSKGPTWVRTAHACDDRVYEKDACISVSRMPLTGHLSLEQTENSGAIPLISEIPIEGEMVIASRLIEHAELELRFDGGQVHLRWEADASDLSVDRFLAKNLASDGTDIDYTSP